MSTPLDKRNEVQTPNKLKRCPFCGHAAPKLYNISGLYMVGCPACCSRSGMQHSKEKAVAYWNDRH